MDSFLGEQPPEELNSWGSEVLPDELEGWARALSLRRGAVDHARDEFVGVVLEEARPLVAGVVEPHAVE